MKIVFNYAYSTIAARCQERYVVIAGASYSKFESVVNSPTSTGGRGLVEGYKFIDSRFRGNDILMSLLRKQESRRRR
jgi:hypothetical protein